MKKQHILQGLSEIFTNVLYNSAKFSSYQIALSIIFGNLAGIKHMNNLSSFTNDRLIQNLLDLKEPINENSISSKLKKLGELCSRKFEDFTLKIIKEFMLKDSIENKIQTIDADSTVKTVYGKQGGSSVGYNPFDPGKNSYHPLMLFCSEHKTLLHSWFRTGSAHTSNGICEILKQVQSSLSEVLTNVFFRGDSGFFNGKLFDLMDEFGWIFLVKAKLTNALKETLKYQAWQKLDSKVEFCEFEYSCAGWSCTRKIKAIRIQTGVIERPMLDKIDYIPSYEYFCYCTNLDNEPFEIHQLYAKRAESENWIEHVKNQLFAGQTLTNDFWANDLLWQLSVFAYNISVMFRFNDKDAKKQEPATFRNWFINVAGKVISHGRDIVVKMYKYYHYKDKWLALTG